MILALSARGEELIETSAPKAIARSFSPAAHVRMLNLWATWCIPCVKEFKDLKAIDQQFDERLEIIGVSLDDAVPDPREVRKRIAREFLLREKVGFKNIYYTGSLPELQEYLNIDGEIPVTILFDGKGREIWRHQGTIDRRDVIRRVNAILKTRERKP